MLHSLYESCHTLLFALSIFIAALSSYAALALILMDRLLERQTAYKDSLLESSIDSIVIFDASLRIVECNPAAERTFGWSRNSVLGRSLTEFVQLDAWSKRLSEPEDGAPLPAGCWQALPGTRWKTTAMNAAGETLPIKLTVKRIIASGPALYTACIRDMTERLREEELIRRLASDDMLTGLPNRIGFRQLALELFAGAARDGRPAALFFMDMDRFKLINDTLGHQTGDLLLQTVAVRLKEQMGENDIVGRLGGDEFLVLLPDTDALGAQDAAARLTQALTRPFVLEGHSVVVACSIGIALYPADGESLDVLIKQADTAMYEAKERGKNNVRFYEQAMKAAAQRKMELEQGLRQALERGEFVLHYQPKYELSTGRISGVEALVRWQNPQLGLVPPSEFIPLAEETRLIVSLSEWIVREACRQNKAWQNAGYPPMTMAVNLSMVELREDHLTSLLHGLLEEHGLATASLELEVTESAAMQEEAIVAKLRALRAMGVKLSIDDFGTGYSSLSYLRRLPIDTVKIDRSFVAGAASSDLDAALLRAIVAMVRSLGLNALAEGVETPEQLALLRQLHCDEGQGYLLCRPVPAGQLERLLRDAGEQERVRLLFEGGGHPEGGTEGSDGSTRAG